MGFLNSVFNKVPLCMSFTALLAMLGAAIPFFVVLGGIKLLF